MQWAPLPYCLLLNLLPQSFFPTYVYNLPNLCIFSVGVLPGTRPKTLQPQRLQYFPIFIGTMITYSTLPPPHPVSMLEFAIHWDNLVFASNEINHTIYWFVYSTLPPPPPCFCWRFNQIQIFIELGGGGGRGALHLSKCESTAASS